MARIDCGLQISNKAISIGVLSKSYGLPGLRVGWIAGKDAGVLKK